MVRSPFAAAALLALLPVLAQAQGPQLKLPNFDHLQKRATDSVNITLGSWPLGIATWFMDENDPEDAEMKAVLRGLKAIYVRSYQFDADFVYSEQDVEAVRSQLIAPVWSPLIEVRDRKQSHNVDVYVALDGNHANGLAVVASEPRKITILNIVGHIDLDKLATLEDRFGLPKFGIEGAETARTE